MNYMPLIVFLLGVCFFVAGFQYFNKLDSIRYKMACERIDACVKQYAELSATINSNIFTVGSFNQRIEDVKSCNARIVKEFETLGEHVEAVSLRCNEVREKQIALQEKLSNKRPVIKISEPIQFKIVEKKKLQGIKALIKEKK